MWTGAFQIGSTSHASHANSWTYFKYNLSRFYFTRTSTVTYEIAVAYIEPTTQDTNTIGGTAQLIMLFTELPPEIRNRI